MANFEHMVPFIIEWEAGAVKKKGESNAALFERARKKGYANDKDDKGGATQTGVTLSTYKAWCKKHAVPDPGVLQLQAIPYAHWLAILKAEYWDRWKADRIITQGIAEICVDWVWASGRYGITGVQKLLGTTADGIVGTKTLTLLNSRPQVSLFAAIRQARLDFVDRIVKNNPSQKKWLKGWKRRINAIKYTEE